MCFCRACSRLPPSHNGQNFGRVHALAVGFGEVAWPIIVDDAGYSTGLLGIPAGSLESLDVPGYAKELSQVSARRTSRDADAIRIDLVFLRIGPQPANGRLHVMDGRRELIFRCEAIADRHGDVAMLGQPNAKAVVSLPAAGPEAAAVNAGNRRKRPIASLGPGHVELKVLAVRVRVFDVWLEDDILRHGEVGRFLSFGELGSQQAKCRCDDKSRTSSQFSVSPTVVGMSWAIVRLPDLEGRTLMTWVLPGNSQPVRLGKMTHTTPLESAMPRGIPRNKEGISKMEGVRLALAELGSDADNRDIEKFLQSEFSIDMDLKMISSYKTKLKAAGRSAIIRKPVEAAVAHATISKMEGVRRALTELGKDAANKELQEFLKTRFGIDMELQMISNYKTHLKAAGKSAVIRKPAEAAAAPKATGGISLDDIRAVKELLDKVGAENVRQLAEVLGK